MNIKKVIKKETYYLVNEYVSVPFDENNRDYQKIKAWLEIKGNKLSPAFTKDKIIEKITREINSEAGNRILSVYPDYKQRNIDRQASLFPEEKKKQKAQLDMHNFIGSIINKATVLKNSLQEMTLKQLEAFNALSDNNWK